MSKQVYKDLAEKWSAFDTYETDSYLAGMKILLGNERLYLAGEQFGHESVTDVAVNGERYSLLSLAVEGNEDDWDSLVLSLVILKVGDETEVKLKATEIEHKDAFALLSAVYLLKEDSKYEDLGEFLGYEVS